MTLPHLQHVEPFFAHLAKPVLIGILNITPDSFSDANQFLTPPAAIAHGYRMIAEGATILDLGPEASSFFRPGVVPVHPQEQLRRLLPVVGGLAGANNVLMSVDTRSARVARAAIEAGAHLINDVSAGTHDPAMLATAADLACPIILMHTGPTYPDTPSQNDPDITHAVLTFLQQRIAAALNAGIAANRILIDPGLGFGKTPHDNWTLCARLDRFLATGHHVVLGASRKRFLIGDPASPTIPKPAERDPLTALVTALAAARGVLLHRVHNIPLNAQALAVADQFNVRSHHAIYPSQRFASGL